jgi:hypothetical protein
MPQFSSNPDSDKIISDTLIYHQQVLYHILDLINGEMELRPTFQQALSGFKQAVPFIDEARIEEERKERFGLQFNIGNKGEGTTIGESKQLEFVKEVRETYFNAEKSLLSADG